MQNSKFSELRQKLHLKYREQNKQGYRRTLIANRMKNINILMTKTQQDHFQYQISKFVKQLSPIDALKAIKTFIEANQDTIQQYLKSNMKQFLEITIKQYPDISAIQLTKCLIKAQIKQEQYQHFQIVYRVINMIENNLKDHEKVQKGIDVLVEIAYYQDQNSQFFRIKEFCLKYYEYIKHIKSTIFLISFLGKSKQYFPQKKEILADVIQSYSISQNNTSTIFFDIITNYIEYAPQLTIPHLKQILQICYFIAGNRNFYRANSMFYRTRALTNISLIMKLNCNIQSFLVKQNVMLLIINIIRVEPIQMKQRAFRVLQDFTLYSQRQDINILLTQVPDFIELIEEEGLSSMNNYIKEHALKVIFNCLQKFEKEQKHYKQCNPFKTLLLNSKISIVQTLDNFAYHKSAEISQLAANTLQKYFKEEDNNHVGDNQRDDIYYFSGV